MSNQAFSQTFPFVISNSFSSLQNIPDQDIKNPLDAVNYVNAVEIIPDPAFQLKGMLIVTVNDLPVFSSPSVGFFKNYSRFSIPVTARQLNRQGHIKIFAWNGLADGSPISASGTVIISDKNQDASSGSIASTSPRGSDTLTLFNYVLRAIGTYTQQIDLAGYKKLLLLIASASYIKPVSVSVLSNSHYSIVGLNNIIDGDLTTHASFDGTPAGLGGSATATILVDWGSNNIRQFAYNVANSGVGSGYFNDNEISSVQLSVDNITYFAWVPNTNQTFRYAKVNFSVGIPMSSPYPQCWVNEIYDANVFGGTASLSFEAFEPSSGQWIEVISAASIGTISQGQAISKQLGDTMAQSNLNNILASNFAGLRVKLTITGGGLQTAVSVQRLA